MHTNTFFERIEHQLQLYPGKHVLQEDLTPEAVAAWNLKHPNLPIPEEWLQVLKRSNGLGISRARLGIDCPGHEYEIIDCGAVQFFPLGAFSAHGYELELASVVISGAEDDSNLPSTWLAIGADTDSTMYVCLDSTSGRFYEVDPTCTDESTLLAENLGVLLDWAATFLDLEW